MRIGLRVNLEREFAQVLSNALRGNRYSITPAADGVDRVTDTE
jgi:hypothetical protein